MPDEVIKNNQEDSSHDYKRLFEAAQQQVRVLEQRLQKYEFHGGVRLYYSLNRKLNEIAEVLNNNKIDELVVEDGKDKRFERIRALWTDAERIITACQAIAAMLNIKGDNEEIDVRKKVPFVETIAQSRNQ